MIEFYKENKTKIRKIVEIIFEVLIYIVVFLGHKMGSINTTYEYRVCFALMFSFGMWLCYLDDRSAKSIFYDLGKMFFVPFIGALIVAKLTGKVDVMDVMPVLYILPIVFIYLWEQKKYEYRINGKKVMLTSKQFINQKIGVYSIVPRISLYIIVILYAFLNLPIEWLVPVCFAVDYIFNYVYLRIIDEFVVKNDDKIIRLSNHCIFTKKNDVQKFKRNYRYTQFYIILIIISIIICLICSYYLQSKAFLSSTLLNIFGGLFTGLIILLYQFYSKKKIEKTSDIINKLQVVNEIKIEEASIRDFDSEEYMSDPDDEDAISKVFKYDEGVALAFDKYTKNIKEAKKQFDSIVKFNKDVLELSVDIDMYEKRIDCIINYFDKYTVEEEYERNGSGGCDQVRYVYENNKKIKTKVICNEWIDKVNNLRDEINVFNSELYKEKDLLIEYHKNRIIIN